MEDGKFVEVMLLFECVLKFVFDDESVLNVWFYVLVLDGNGMVVWDFVECVLVCYFGSGVLCVSVVDVFWYGGVFLVMEVVLMLVEGCFGLKGEDVFCVNFVLVDYYCWLGDVV